MLKLIFWIVVLVLVLSFFGITIESIVHSPAGEANFGYVGKLVSEGWRFIVTFVVGAIHVFKAVAS